MSTAVRQVTAVFFPWQEKLNIVIFVQLELQWKLLPSRMRRIVVSQRSSAFRINFHLKFQDRYPWERSSKFLQLVVPIYISAMHHVTWDSDCTARKSGVACTVCFTDREAAVLKNPFYLVSSLSEPNERRSFGSNLFANALLFSWKLNRTSHNV